MNQTPYLIAILFTFMLAGPVTRTVHASDGVPTTTELENATYSGVEDGPVTLSNGYWEGEPYVEGGAARPRVGPVKDASFMDDLDGDGQQEAAVILWQSAAGTGSNTYIAVMSKQNGGVNNVSTVLIGDRVKLRSGKIVDGKIILEVLQAGENDAMCCPSLLATRTWSLEGNQLVEGEMEKTGELSLAVLEGTGWKLTHMDRGQAVAEGAEVTLEFVGDRIAGKSACNQYSASIKDGESAGDIHIGQLMSTMMACPGELMNIEREYLDALSHTTNFSFYTGKLSLSGMNKDGKPFTMLFARDETQNVAILTK